MEKASIDERLKIKSYKNFNVALYIPVNNVLEASENVDAFDARFQKIQKHINIGRVYIESYRGKVFATKQQLTEVKRYFESKNIACSGGITTCDEDRRRGYASLCYSNPVHRNIVETSVETLAEVFDEIIFDDFYFLNCKCEDCIREKKDRTWAQFRKDQKRQVTENLIMKTAHKVNPNCNVIVKFPQWYEDFEETGYDLREDSDLFDSIYTGTETRNPNYSQQHLPKYLSYSIMRYYNSVLQGRNLGGWFDPFDATNSLNSYLEQGYLTLFAKANEITLFCFGALVDDTNFRYFVPGLAQCLDEIDGYLDKLGNPVGIASYRPTNAKGEDNLHSYLGNCGMPMEMSAEYDTEAKCMLLTEGAAYDIDIADKMKKSLSNGADIIVTSGFVRRMGEAFKEFANITYSSRKAIVKNYADSKDQGITIGGSYAGDEEILIPILDYCTNDVWELAAAYGTANNFPIVLRFTYDKGRISVITIPDNQGDLYHYPLRVLNIIRGLAENSMSVSLSAPSNVLLFVYDNDHVIVRSDLDYAEVVTIKVPRTVKKAKNLVNGTEVIALNGKIAYQALPGVNYVFELM